MTDSGLSGKRASELFRTDAIDLPLDEEGSLLFENKSIKDFLLSPESSCIASPKGFGKTLLLRVKKRRVQKDTSIYCIPQNQELDTIADIPFGKNLLSILNNYHNWVLLWKVSISLAAIKFACKGKEDKDKEYRDDVFNTLHPVLCNILERVHCDTPCEILNYILTFEIKNLMVVLANVGSVAPSVNRIKKQCAFFIDSVDEKLSPFLFNGHNVYENTDSHTNIWYYAQYSILQVMHDLKKTERHIKIYCGIRQEVNKGYLRCSTTTELHDQFSTGCITEINYSYEDLREMFEKYVDCLNKSELICPELRDSNKITAFFGKATIENLHTSNTPEDPFHYIYRHSLKRPRDIMDMCRAICREGIRTDIDKFKTTVNNRAINIAEKYLSNVEPFIVDELNEEHIKPFIKKLNTNIFRKQELLVICSTYSKNNSNYLVCSNNECRRCDNPHPFCMLYNVGLLGYVKDDVVIGRKTQCFLSPGYSLHTAKSTLPESAIYFLHPSVNDWLKSDRNLLPDAVCKSFVIGDSNPITQEQINNALGEIEANNLTINQFNETANQKKEMFRKERKALSNQILESRNKIKDPIFVQNTETLIQGIDDLKKTMKAHIGQYYCEIQGRNSEAKPVQSIMDEFEKGCNEMFLKLKSIASSFAQISTEFNNLSAKATRKKRASATKSDKQNRLIAKAKETKANQRSQIIIGDVVQGDKIIGSKTTGSNSPIVTANNVVHLCDNEVNLENEINKEKCDIGIITIVTEEAQAVLSEFELIEKKKDERLCYEGTHKLTTGKTLNVVHLQSSRQGNISAALAYQFLKLNYQPNYIVLLGIAGSINKDIKLCDVLIGTCAIYYEKKKDSEDKLQRRGEFFNVSFDMRQNINSFFVTNGEPASILASQNSYCSIFNTFQGPMGSGETVIANPLSEIKEWLLTVHSKTSVVETEAAGFCQAFYETQNKDTSDIILIRGISDHADFAKNDAWRLPASKNAVIVLKNLLEVIYKNK